MAVQSKTQRDERRDIPSVDQFDRPWHVVIEIKTGDPCHIGPAGWEDPLHTPIGRQAGEDAVARVPRGPHGYTLLGKVLVDFKLWVDRQRREEQGWKLNLFNIAQDTYKGKFDPRALEDDEYVMHLAGPKPWPPVAVLERCQRGDLNDPLTRQFLGLEPLGREARKALNRMTVEDFEAMAQPTDGEALVFPDEYKEFVSVVIKRGLAKTIGEAAELWRQHKAALAEA